MYHYISLTLLYKCGKESQRNQITYLSQRTSTIQGFKPDSLVPDTFAVMKFPTIHHKQQ